MGSISITQLLWHYFLFSLLNRFGKAVLLKHCGEFYNDGSNFSADNEKLGFESELGQLFDGINEMNPFKLYNALKLLRTVEINEPTEFSNNITRTIPDRIRADGYPCEVHSVETSDGYILELYRIPFSPKSTKTDEMRQAVLLMHPLLESANCFVALGPDHSLAYLLADANNDVWLGNARGTDPSRGHVSIDPNSEEYWSYSWHEIGVYDIPASIDHILLTTKHKKLNYIGYSQGTTALLVLLSMRPEYNEKIIEASLLAPSAYLRDPRKPFLKILNYLYTPVLLAIESLGIHKIQFSHNSLMRIAEYCSDAHREGSTPLACKLVLTVLNSDQINCTSLHSMAEFSPSGISTKQVLHYIQLIFSGEFRQYDHGNQVSNIKAYGHVTPPPYDLSRITAPVNLFFSRNDTTCLYENVKKLQSQLPNVKQSYVIPIPDFEHTDFVYSRYVRRALNDKIVETINIAENEICD